MNNAMVRSQHHALLPLSGGFPTCHHLNLGYIASVYVGRETLLGPLANGLTLHLGGLFIRATRPWFILVTVVCSSLCSFFRHVMAANGLHKGQGGQYE